MLPEWRLGPKQGIIALDKFGLLGCYNRLIVLFTGGDEARA